MTPHLEAVNLTKRFGKFTANDSISVCFKKGTIHAVIGENGAGKSTLMKTLFGLQRPDAGTILINGTERNWKSPLDAIEAGVGMVQQHFTLVPVLSAIENIILGAEKVSHGGILDRKAAVEEMRARLPSPKLEVPWDEPVEKLSVGDRQKVEILKLLYRKAEILILDEPTAVLTPQETEDLFEVLRQLRDEGRTIIIISHKLNEIFALCDEFTVLRGGRVTGSGRIAETSIEKVIELMMGTQPKPLSSDRRPRQSQVFVHCRDVRSTSTFRGSLRGLTLQVFSGEIVGIAGVEGAGQAALVSALMGLSDFLGDVEVLGQRPTNTKNIRAQGIGLIPEDRLIEGLWPTESGYHNLVIGLEGMFTKNGFMRESLIRSQADQWAKDFDVRGASLESPVQSLSGGNQQKLIFAREVAGRQPKVMICHQPTRGVDLGAVRHIHENLIQLRNQGMGLLVLSSDLDELMTLSDRIYVLFEGRVSDQMDRKEFERSRIGRAMAGVK